MKLVIFSQLFYPFKGGIQRLIKSRIDCLEKSKLKKTLLISSQTHKSFNKEFKQVRINYTKNRLQQFLSAFLSILKIVYNENYIQIECASIFPSGIASGIIKFFSRKKIRLIIYLHGDEILKSQNNYVYLFLIRFTCISCDELISNSNYIKKFFKSKINKNAKINIINPIPSKNFYQIPSKNFYQKGYLKKNKKYTLLSVCRLVDKKNLVNQICAFEKIYLKYSKKYRGLNYIICGSGPEHSKLKKIIKSRNLEKIVKIYNDVSDSKLIKFYKSSDIFIMTTLTNFKKNNIEGFGISALEASLFGMTCILPKNSGSNDLKKIGGVKFFVDGNSLKQIENTILYALKLCKSQKKINSSIKGANNLIHKSIHKYRSKF